MRRRDTLTRRAILHKGGVYLCSAAVIPQMIERRAVGGVDAAGTSARMCIGVVGVGGMGTGHLHQLLGVGDVRVVAVADVFEPHRQRAAERVGGGCRTYGDYRELLARSDIDAVVIATPDHWHAKVAIDACEAGKDVYCEKPLSLTVREARSMVRAARENATVFQVGTQQRSSAHFRLACEVVRSGRIGRLEWMKARIGRGPTCGWEPSEVPPTGLDWDFWLGPAVWADYTPKRCLYNFRWFYDYSGGRMTDWGAHHMDIAQWGHGSCKSGPVKFEPISVDFPTTGLFETATRFEVKATYADGVVLYISSEGNDVEFHGTQGWVKVNRGRLATSNGEIEKEPLGAGDVHLYESPGHHRDWLNCIRTRRRPICDVEIGARSVTICHLANIALRTGRSIEWDPVKEEITNDPNLNRWLSRAYRAPWRL